MVAEHICQYGSLVGRDVTFRGRRTRKWCLCGQQNWETPVGKSSVHSQATVSPCTPISLKCAVKYVRACVLNGGAHCAWELHARDKD